MLGEVQLQPRSLEVLSGDQARFSCSSATPWLVLTWSVNRRAVMTISAEHGILSNSDRFTAANFTTAASSVWELTLWNVTRDYTGDVTCDLQNIGRQTATLSVQVLGEVQLQPRSLEVLSGDQARFSCSSATPWLVLTWSVNRRAVMTISAEHGILSNSDRFTAANFTTAASSVWELTLWNVTRDYTGDVTCDLQNIGRQTATLSVQEGGTVGISGGNVTSRKGSRVLFRCQASDWFPEPQVTWALGGQEVNNTNSSSVNTLSGLFHSTTSLLVLAEESTWVECQASIPALPTPKTHSVFLTIIEDPGGEGQRVLVVALVSALAALLLVLLITAIVCWCRSRTNYGRYLC
ncbi:immunoglobulin superfamily member 5-like [Conger conger]|uniref:immunoglobulin superfamily member 5-like n=1 Tax=Conger conger TaxID=82655 RepID=UPI002A5A0AF6|nr:immunoglobulin superfamily member 5-like [Conger conger]